MIETQVRCTREHKVVFQFSGDQDVPDQAVDGQGVALKHSLRDRCCCSPVVVYNIKTQELVINNGACPTWRFCEGPEDSNGGEDPHVELLTTMEKDEIREVLDILEEVNLQGIERCKEECCCPLVAFYKVRTHCLTINNGACPDWEFCRD